MAEIEENQGQKIMSTYAKIPPAIIRAKLPDWILVHVNPEFGDDKLQETKEGVCPDCLDGDEPILRVTAEDAINETTTIEFFKHPDDKHDLVIDDADIKLNALGNMMKADSESPNWRTIMEIS